VGYYSEYVDGDCVMVKDVNGFNNLRKVTNVPKIVSYTYMYVLTLYLVKFVYYILPYF